MSDYSTKLLVYETIKIGVILFANQNCLKIGQICKGLVGHVVSGCASLIPCCWGKKVATGHMTGEGVQLEWLMQHKWSAAFGPDWTWILGVVTWFIVQ